MSSSPNDRLCAAAEEGDALTIVKLLRRLPTLDVNARDSYPFGESALTKASKGGHFEVVRLLLDAGAEPNIHDAILVTPLHVAAQGGHIDVIKLLLLHKANPAAKTKNGMTARDFTTYSSLCWKILNRSMRGYVPKLPEHSDVVPVIPRRCIPKPPPEELDPVNKKKVGQKAKKR